MTERPSTDRWLDTQCPEQQCPLCGHRLSAAGSPEGHSPGPGDFSVCICCASPLVFTDDMTVRAATPADLAGLDAQEAAQLCRYQAVVRSLDRRQMG